MDVVDHQEQAFLSTGDLAIRLGVTRQRARQITKAPDFPPPAARATRRGIPLWRGEDIERWVSERRPDRTDDDGGLIELWSAPDIGKFLDVPVHTVSSLPDLPAPTHRHRKSRLWDAATIRAWAAGRS
ncbi:helix-turn-helix transcriptional regulator [Frankia tisae]|uniref:helix-turn-helix transcriptional regulator n=1 Tax=Frankia tisae TaxID=2950104 RepID=UPI0021C11A36|nr:hypothetical protein [Frankia tisae]